MNEPDALATLLLEEAQEAEEWRAAILGIEERMASFERRLDRIMDLLTEGSSGKSLNLNGKRFSITVTRRDESERIAAVEIS